MIRLRMVGVGVVIGVAIAGCGVRLQGEPQPLERREVPYGLLDRGDEVGGGTDELTSTIVYFLKDERLVAVPRRLSMSVTPEAVVDALLRGLTPEEAVAGLVSAIPTATPRRSVTLVGTVVLVDLGAEVRDAADIDAVFRQLDATLRELPGVEQVRLLAEGTELEPG